MIAELVLSMAVMGQCYYGPAPMTYPVVVAPAEHQVLCNHGPVQSKFYTSVRLHDGYRTSIPVINCIVPQVNVRRTYNGGRQLTLDYSRGHHYSKVRRTNGVICYQSCSKSSTRLADDDPRPRPIPYTRAADPKPTPADPKPEPDAPGPPEYFSDRMDALERKVDTLIDKVEEQPGQSAVDVEGLKKLIEELRAQQQETKTVPPPAQSPVEDEPALKSPLMDEETSGIDPQSPLIEPWMRPTNPFTGTVPQAPRN